MIVLRLIFSFIIIFLAGKFILSTKPFSVKNEPPSLRFSLYFFAGTTVISLYMFVLSLLHISYGALVVSLPFILYSITLIPEIRTYLSNFRISRLTVPRVRLSLSAVIYAVLFLLVLAIIINCSITPIFSKDAFAMWFLKARIFFVERSIPFDILTKPFYVYSSPEYPQLVPLNLAFISICLGQWNDILLRLFFATGYAMFMLFFYGSLIRFTHKTIAAAACLFLLGNVHILEYATNGYVDLTLGMFAAIATIYFQRFMDEKRSIYLMLSSFFMGSAAFVKNDGIALFVALSVTLFLFLYLTYRKNLDMLKRSLIDFAIFIFTGFLIFMPWQVVSASHSISSHMIKSANVLTTMAANIGRAPGIAQHFLFELYLNTYSWQYFWIFITLFILIGRGKLRASNSKYILIFLFASLSLYFMVYILTVADNLASSFHRLLIGLAPSAAFLAFSLGHMEET